jgi:hypothetical protein
MSKRRIPTEKPGITYSVLADGSYAFYNGSYKIEARQSIHWTRFDEVEDCWITCKTFWTGQCTRLLTYQESDEYCKALPKPKFRVGAKVSGKYRLGRPYPFYNAEIQEVFANRNSVFNTASDTAILYTIGKSHFCTIEEGDIEI